MKDSRSQLLKQQG